MHAVYNMVAGMPQEAVLHGVLLFFCVVTAIPGASAMQAHIISFSIS